MLPHGYRLRPATLNDSVAVAALIAACQLVDEGRAEMTEAELRDDWSGIDISEDAAIVLDPDGRIVASVDATHSRYISVSVYGQVHPDQRGRGIGAALVAWGEGWARQRLDRAPEEARVTVQHFIVATNERARRLMERSGFAPVRGVYVMSIDLDGPQPAPVWPPGVTVRAMVMGRDEQAAHEAHEDAFRDLWGRPRSTFERFLHWTRQDGFDPTLCFLAEEGEQIAGVLFGKVASGHGWIEVVGVRRPWRGRGLGLALMREALAEYGRRGVREVGLSVDAQSLTGAPRLYTRAGMHVAQNFIRYEKEIRPGEDLTRRSDE